jgi:hypothetical protein
MRSASCCRLISSEKIATGSRRLSHPGTGRDDHHVGLLEPRCQLVQIAEAGGNAGDQLLLLVKLLDLPHRFLAHLRHRVVGGFDLLLGDRENRLLGLVEEVVDLAHPLERGIRDLLGHGDHLPENRLLFDKPCVVGDVRGGGNVVDEFGEVGKPPNFARRIPGVQGLGKRQLVDRAAALVKLHHRGEKRPVGALIKVVRPDDLHNVVHQVVVEKDRGEHGLLGLETVGRNLQERCIRRSVRRQPRTAHIAPFSRRMAAIPPLRLLRPRERYPPPS